VLFICTATKHVSPFIKVTYEFKYKQVFGTGLGYHLTLCPSEEHRDIWRIGLQWADQRNSGYNEKREMAGS